ncbi:MAG: phosphocarrier protein HPr [Candidatus Omnitrophota bacterium]|jgi:phosphocarrier protein HPr
MSEPICKEVTVQNEYGFHLVPAGMFVKTAGQFKAKVTVCCRGNGPVPATSIMALVTIQADKGSVIKITAEGEDADAAADALVDLVNSKFGED